MNNIKYADSGDNKCVTRNTRCVTASLARRAMSRNRIIGAHFRIGASHRYWCEPLGMAKWHIIIQGAQLCPVTVPYLLRRLADASRSASRPSSYVDDHHVMRRAYFNNKFYFFHFISAWFNTLRARARLSAYLNHRFRRRIAYVIINLLPYESPSGGDLISLMAHCWRFLPRYSHDGGVRLSMTRR